MLTLKEKNSIKFITFAIVIFIIIIIVQPFEKNLYSSSKQNDLKIEADCLNNYKITISLSSYDYFVYQSIPLNIEFEFTGNKIDSLNLNSTNLSKNFLVENSKKEISKWGGAIDYPLYIKFLPGEKKVFNVDLNLHFGFAKFETPNLFGFYTYFPPDTYTAQYKIMASQVKSPAFMEKCNTDESIHSNIIHFKVIDPTGENKKALDLIKEIYKLNKMGGKEIDKFFTLNNIFIKEYYNSIYIEYIFNQLSAARVIYKRYDSSALEEAKIILENHPDNEISRSAIELAYNYYKANYNEGRALQFLEETKQIYKNQEAGKWAENELERIRGN